jgi:hypothetical protein
VLPASQFCEFLSLRWHGVADAPSWLPLMMSD